MKIYLVGGAVRDDLLGLPVKERDWVVVGAERQQLLDLGYFPVDREFPVFLHPESGEEYALARREVKTGTGYKGFEVYSGPDVTLEEDLLRRDLTVNAMARDGNGQIIDPYNGQEDLADGMLRHVSPAFVEDPVRLLRIARFAAKLGRWGFRIAHGTHSLMKKMSAGDDLAALRPERIWQEMRKALAEDQPWRFFEVLHRCGALQGRLPGVAGLMGDPASHKAGASSPAIEALKRATEISPDPTVRLTAFAYGLPIREGDLSVLPLERDYADLMELVLHCGDRFRACEKGAAEQLLDLIEQSRGLQQPQRFERLLEVCSALWPEASERVAPRLRQALEICAPISARELQQAGLQGAAIGEALRLERLEALLRRDI
jgi:tRNA nucleotidyltransferase (CCA-adding enzyme)